jgi:hypothetical protein
VLCRCAHRSPIRRFISIPLLLAFTATATAVLGTRAAEAAGHTVSGLAAAPTTQTVGAAVQLTATLDSMVGIILDNPVTVSFSMTGANAGTSISPCTVQSFAQTCTSSYTGTLSGSDTVRAQASGADPGSSTTVTWQGIPASLALTPQLSFNTVGQNLSLVATVTDLQGKPVPGANVAFTVTGPGATSGSGTTDGQGNAGFSFSSASSGKSSIAATVPVGSGSISGNATANWAGPPSSVVLSLFGQTQASGGFAPVNATATVVAAVTDSGGIPIGDNTAVKFFVTGAGRNSGTVPTSAGNAVFTFGSGVTGTATITATVAPAPTSNAVTVTWQSPVPKTISITPKQTRAVIGSRQILNVKVLDQFGRPFGGALVRFILSGVNGQAGTFSGNTQADGATAFLYTGTSPGIDTLVAFVDLQNSRNPDPGDPVDTANIFWALAPGQGYWLVASDGGIFNYGPSTTFEGSTGSIHLNQPIVGIARTPSGFGYWLVASDGGIFAFGDAVFRGSTGATHLNQPIVGMAATPDGGGYWLVASDGGIFAFGDAVFRGSTGSIHLNQPIVGIAATPTGLGYWMAASDGGIFNFGDAPMFGSLGSIHLNKPVVGIAAISDGSGYFMVATDGGVFNFGPGSALFGSAASQPLNKPVVAIAVAP